ncbi:hypothetical protein HMN09_00395200 [Mycena chlorophos]|uniref:Uncharacterized protein n=1 Tax=Mycena chlorophos TaxID=658473 RepID=A0A8H6TFY1_MYCCL|nr:hypothetical protein HMN09_00395200 [Mycena chlorophos]
MALLLASQRFSVVLRRPWGFGLPTFVSMVSAMLDIDFHPRKDPFLSLSQWMGSSPPIDHVLHANYVLQLDFATLRGKELRETLLAYVYGAVIDFIEHYELLPQDFPPLERWPSDEPAALIWGLVQPQHQLCLIVGNFDAPLTAFRDGPKILNPFLRSLQQANWVGKISGLLLWSCIDDNGSVGACRYRKSESIPLGKPPRGVAVAASLPDAIDFTHHPALQSAVGFTEKQVNELDAAARRDETLGSKGF